MKIRTACTCRGDGKAYIEIFVTKFSPLSRLFLTGTTFAGNKVPTQLHVLDETDKTKHAVLVFPIATCPLTLSIQEMPVDGRECPSVPITVRPHVLKWMSRFNYRFKSETCALIRDIDQDDFFSHATIKLDTCIPSKTTNILRGLLFLPWAEEKPYSLKLLNGALEEIPCEIITMTDIKIPQKPTTPVDLQRIVFSCRIPQEIAPYTLYFENPTGDLRSNFAVLEAAAYAQRLDDFRQVTLNAAQDPAYPLWFAKKRVSQSEKNVQRKVRFSWAPLISIVVPLYKTPLPYFRAMVESVLDQTYQNFELLLVNADPENEALGKAVAAYTHSEPRIREIKLSSNGGISKNTYAGIKEAQGEYVAFLDHDDTLEADALFEYVYALNNNATIDLLYCDEDKLLPDGQYATPYFKPDFSPFLLREINYICHFLMVRKSTLEKLTLDDSRFDGAQDHHLILQAVDCGARVHHVARVLYHWRVAESSTAAATDNKPYADAAAKRAIGEHLSRRSIKAAILPSADPCRFRLIYEAPTKPLVSLIIPNKDSQDILDTCLMSVLEKSTYQNFEIILVENNSTDPNTFSYYDDLLKRDKRIRLITWEHEFNFSKLMNFGAQHAQGEYFILLNNDTEIITPNWIEVMLGICCQEEVGVVGAKLYYPDGTIQHAGVYVEGEAAGHINLNLDKSNPGYFNTTMTTHELSAVTAACIMTKREVFACVGGFDEELAIAFNDIDYCLKVRERGLSVIFSPNVELFHYESLSRGYEVTLEKQTRFKKELSLLGSKWPQYMVIGDPFRNPNLDPDNCYYHLETSPKARWYGA